MPELLRDRLVREATNRVDAHLQDFWNQVDVNGPVAVLIGTPCWLWVGSTRCRGYGQFSISGRQLYCHRISWMLEYGDIPAGLHVCHSCDVPLCVRPSHLFLGTVQDNMADRDAKGRGLRGENNGASKLTATQVRELRRLQSRGSTYKQLAARFSISAAQAHNIANGAQWRSVQ